MSASADPRTLTLSEAVETAVRNNLTLERAGWDLDAKKRQSDKAWNVFLPSASVAGTLSRSLDTTNSVTGAAVKPSTTAVGTAKLALTLPGNILVSLEAVALNYRSGQLAYDQARRSVEKAIRSAWYGILLEQENLRVTRDSVGRSEQNLAKVQANYKAGLVPDLDVLQAQVSLESLRPSVRQLQASYDNDLGQLKLLLGLSLDDDIQLAGDLTQPVEKGLNLTGLDYGRSSPDVQKAQLSLDSSDLSRRSQELATWLPAVSLGWTSQPTYVDVFNEVYPKRTAQNWQDNGSVSLTFSYSLDGLIPWTGTSETLLQAQDGVKKAQSQLKEAQNTSDLTRRNAVHTIEQAVQTLASLDLNVELARKSYDLASAAYQKGARDLLSVQSAEGDLDNARYRVLAQRASLLTSILNLEYELDVPFGTILQE